MWDTSVILFILVILLVDRFVFGRGKIKIVNVELFEFKDGYFSFQLEHVSKLPLYFTRITYELRDLAHPTTVIAGKERSLDFSKDGKNQELLFIKKKDVMNINDPWQINIKIVSAGSRYNPLYKIFPQVDSFSAEITLPSEESHESR